MAKHQKNKKTRPAKLPCTSDADQDSYVDGKIMYSAAVEKYWDDLSSPWCTSTKVAYLRDYTKYLGPYFGDKPLADYDDPTYFRWVIEDLKRVFKAQSRAPNEDSLRERLQHFRYILKRLMDIVSAGEGFISPVIGYSMTEELIPAEEKELRARTELQKSFSPQQECKLADILLSNPLCDGRTLGIALMWIYGYRNKCSCGLSFGDWTPMPENEELDQIILHTTTIGNTRNIHSWGKNENVFRILPALPRISAIIRKRREHIQNLVDAGEINLPEGIDTVDKLPIVCKGNDWTVRATSNELSIHGRLILNEIKLTDEQREFFSTEADPESPLDIIAWDRDPTTYTFRRNCATHLFILGMSLTQVQWFFGHKFTETDMPRHYFVNPDEQMKLYNIIKNRPLVNDITFEPTVTQIESSAPYGNFCDFHGQISGINARVRLIFTPNVPYEASALQIRSTGSTSATYWQRPIEDTPTKVNMLGDYYAAYRRALKEHTRQQQFAECSRSDVKEEQENAQE